MTKSKLKTKMRRAGFRAGYGYGGWRKNWEYCHAFGRPFRVRFKAGVVDIGEVYETFDRWANSTERTLTIEEFAKEYLK